MFFIEGMTGEQNAMKTGSRRRRICWEQEEASSCCKMLRLFVDVCTACLIVNILLSAADTLVSVILGKWTSSYFQLLSNLPCSVFRLDSRRDLTRFSSECQIYFRV